MLSESVVGYEGIHRNIYRRKHLRDDFPGLDDVCMCGLGAAAAAVALLLQIYDDTTK